MEKGGEFNKLENGGTVVRVCGRRFALARSQSAPLRSTEVLEGRQTPIFFPFSFFLFRLRCLWNHHIIDNLII